MKIINYRQYYYGGEFTEEKIILPENSKVYELNSPNVLYKVKDIEEDVWTKDYLIITEEPYEECYKISDNLYLNPFTLQCVYLHNDNNFSLDTVFPEIKDCYFASYCMNSNTISSISKILEFTSVGFKVATASFKSLIDKKYESFGLTIDTLEYDKFWNIQINKDYKELYNNRIKELYSMCI